MVFDTIHAVGPGPRHLFVFAHPDDDVFIAGTMRKLLEKGADVHCAWMTSGEARTPKEIREAELSQAMDILGVPASNRHLIHFPNRGLLPALDKGARVLEKILGELTPRTIYTTAYEGGHIDHDALNFMVWRAWKRNVCNAELYEFPLYNKTGPLYLWRWRVNGFPPGGTHALSEPMHKELVRLKYKLMRTYVSQRQDMIPFRLAMPSWKLLRRGEPYRIVPKDRNYFTRPHQGTLNYEMEPPSKFHAFQEFCHAVKVAGI